MFNRKNYLLVSITLLLLVGCNNTSTTKTSTSSTTTTHSNHNNSSKTGDPDVKYMTKLALMKGHLLVAKELLDLGKPDQAEPHIGHPVEEIYADLEPQLQERKVKEFKSTLNSLHDLVKSNPKDPKLKTIFADSEQSIDGAIATLPDAQRQSPEFVLKVIDRLADTAGGEYEAAIANGKIAEIVEYQDSRGFIIYADTLYQGISAKMSQKYPQEHQAITANMKELKTVWPTATAPAKPVKTPTQVSQLVKGIEQNIEKVVK